jgi:hypothetical protein
VIQGLGSGQEADIRQELDGGQDIPADEYNIQKVLKFHGISSVTSAAHSYQKHPPNFALLFFLYFISVQLR